MSSARSVQTSAGPAVLKRSDRKTLSISVLPDGSLELIAPRGSSVENIRAKVCKRSRWIARQRLAFSKMNANRVPRRYVSGATHRYLGKQYRLKIRHGKRPSVRLKGAYFYVVSSSGDSGEVEKQLDTWFRDKARDQFTRRLAGWHTWCRRHQLPEPQLVLRRMPKRWGSAGKNGRIALSPELIHAPSACIDYVIAHEICHLKHPDHSPSFFRLLTSLEPDWRVLKDRLERVDST